jgi:hypothetical protein
MNKKAYFVKRLGKFIFIGFYSSTSEAYQENKFLESDAYQYYTDDELYQMIDAAKDALNNISVKA